MLSVTLPRLRAGELVPTLVAGSVIGIMTVILAASFAALIFDGPLAPYVPVGLGMALTTGVLAGVLTPLLSSYRGLISIPQDYPAPILALMAGSIATMMGAAGAPPERIIATVIAALVGATLLTGAVLMAMGALRLGNLIRFVPYPVIGGFLAGTGFLLLRGSLGVMTGLPMELSTLPRLFEPEVLVRWLPGAAIGAALFFALRWIKHSLTMPVVLVLAVAGFYAVLSSTGVTVAEARSAGWLLGPFPSGSLFDPVHFAAFRDADWSIVLGQAGSAATALIVSSIAILLTSSALELAARTEVDLNRELRAAGATNLLVGPAGGLIGFHTLSLSQLALSMGARTRWVGPVGAVVCALALFSGASVLGYFPRPVLGGVLFYLGLAFLAHWLIDARREMPLGDYLIVLLIIGVVAVAGYLQGVAVGITAAVVLFIVSYSRVSVVRRRTSMEHRQSNVGRSRQQQRVLRDHGGEVYILSLQGYIFFATANNLLEEVRARAADAEQPPLRFVVLDFRRVSGLDSSAVLSLVRLRQVAEKEDFRIVLSAVDDVTRSLMERGGLIADDDAIVRLFPDLDHGIEWCETETLRAQAVDLDTAATLLEHLAESWPEDGDPARLLEYATRESVEPGTRLIRQGDPPDCVIFLESGRLTAQLETESGPPVRLQTMGPGTVVGEIGLYMGERRTASVVAETACVVYRLTEARLRELSLSEPAVAAGFHLFMARLLAERLSTTNRTLQAALD